MPRKLDTKEYVLVHSPIDRRANSLLTMLSLLFAIVSTGSFKHKLPWYLTKKDISCMEKRCICLLNCFTNSGFFVSVQSKAGDPMNTALLDWTWPSSQGFT